MSKRFISMAQKRRQEKFEEERRKRQAGIDAEQESIDDLMAAEEIWDKLVDETEEA